MISKRASFDSFINFMKKLRYKLHWAHGNSPKPCLKWTIYDWKLICPIFYTETRVMGRKICAILNETTNRTKET